jgi:hypothetical protein
MAVTTAGLNFIAGAITGAGTFFNNANANIGVGNGTTAVAIGQTDLLGTSKFRQGMDATYPLVAGAVMTFKSTFAPASANFAWTEWGIFNASTGGVMLCRVLETNGTKLSNQTWILELDITVATA